MRWADAQVSHVVRDTPSHLSVQHLQGRSWIASESWVYRMLLKGKAPQSEPFRKWVTEEVLPTIRKTGKYDAEQSSNPIALGLMDELKALRGGYSVAVGVIAVLLHEFCPIRRGVTLQGKRRRAINHAKAVV